MNPYLINAFQNVLQPLNILYIMGGTFLGLLVGALPGLSSPMAIAVLIPLTYGMEPLSAILILIGIYVATKLGGSFSAILIRTPGTPAAACTVLDGYPMAEKGKAGMALGYAVMGSTIGGLIGWLVAIIFVPLISLIAVGVTNADIAMLATCGLILVSSLSRGSMIEGLIAVVIGLLFSTVGMDLISGYDRLTFGISDLLGGIPFIPAMIGIFAVGVVLNDLESMGIKTRRYREKKAKKLRLELPNLKEIFRLWQEILIGAFFGIGIGAIPGIGAVGSTWMSYAVVKNKSKNPEKFGTGVAEGIVTPEASNNAVTGGAMIPMLTLGIPGDPSTAVLLGALLLHGLRPGPLLFKENPEIVYGIMAGLLLANIFMFLQAWMLIKFFIKLLDRDKAWIFPFVLVLAVVGSYCTANAIYVVYVTMFFGVLGYILDRLGIPGAPLILALLLGPIIENNMRLALVLSRGSWITFVNTWPGKISFVVMVGMVLYEIYKALKGVK